jgi:hypothetical protein
MFDKEIDHQLVQLLIYSSCWTETFGILKESHFLYWCGLLFQMKHCKTLESGPFPTFHCANPERFVVGKKLSDKKVISGSK